MTTNLIINKSCSANMPIWIISVDFAVTSTNLQSFKTLVAHRSLRCKIMEVALWKTYLWMQQFRVSPLLRQLRSQRRHAPNQQCRRKLSLQIRSLHRKEVQTWKFQSLTEHLVEVSKRKCLKNWPPNPVGRATAQHPLEDEFADMFEN